MTGDAPTFPTLKPCPFCGGEAGLLTSIYDDNDGDGIVSAIDCLACHARGPGHHGRSSEGLAADAWNKLPRLVDGLRAEPAPPGFALLDEAARHALEDTAEGVLWLRRAVTTLAERHGVKLPPTPKTRKDPT